MRRRRRTSESGQVVLVTAMMATLIFGGMALAVDLSVHTFNQRTIQNVADAAALAGATDLGLVPTSAQQQSGITDALSAVQRNESFPSTWTSGFSASSCTTGGVSGYCETVTYSGYTVTVSTPPKTARSTTNATANDLEVEIHQTVSNSFAGVIGVPTSTVGAHAVGWHAGPPAPYNFTFFSAIDVESGNQQESIYGDTYVGNGYQPQSSGKAGLCVYNDSNGNGRVVFSGVPPSVGSDPTYGVSTSPCPGKGQFQVQATQSTVGSPNCPLGASPVADSNGLQCVLANPPVPAITLPTTTATLCGTNGSATVNKSTAAGIYAVGAGCTVTLSFSSGDINCVDLVLRTGATVNVVDKKSQDFMTSYDFNYNTDTLGHAAIANLTGAPVPTTLVCPGAAAGTSPDTSATHAGQCVICSNPMTGNPTTLSNATTGCCSDSLFVGTIFLPGQTINFSTNQAMEDVGSVYCGDWLVQSGNHPNPVVTHDNGDTAYTAEVLRLVE